MEAAAEGQGLTAGRVVGTRASIRRFAEWVLALQPSAVVGAEARKRAPWTAHGRLGLRALAYAGEPI